LFSSGQIIHSVEEACTTKESAELADLMEAFIGASDDIYVVGGRRDASVHEIPGHTARAAAAVYEPNGRIECTELPVAVEKILKDIFYRNLPSLQYAFPDAARNNGWFYVEYETGQFVNPHVDYHGRLGDPWPGIMATISLSVRNADEGGQFFVESSGDGSIWEQPRIARRGLDWSTPSFRDQRRVRWTAQHEPGDMLVWSSQVIHGTKPVRVGRSCKFLTQLLAAE
jgi:2OG-Fe(II) oxygenase superfamily